MNFVEALKEFQIEFGCVDQTKCALACRVHLDLQLDNTVTELEKIYDSSLDLLYIRAKRAGVTVNFVPFLSCQELDLQEIERIQIKLTENNESKSITLAICDTTSTILYYEMTNGVLEQKK